MVAIKVVGLFDDPSALENAREELLRRDLAKTDGVWTEHAQSRDALPDDGESASFWERLKSIFESDDEHDVGAYAESIRRGGALLVVETEADRAEEIQDVMRQAGAIDLRRRVLRWMSAGWQTFDPQSPMFTEVEILDDRRAEIAESEIAADDFAAPSPDQTIALYVEGSGEMLGRISEAELGVLQAALEEEGPDDDDYWINREEIDSIAGHPEPRHT